MLYADTLQNHSGPVPCGNSRYLVTGGAGFVGSHVVRALHARGDTVVVIDDLSQGHRSSIPAGVRLVVADVADEAVVGSVLQEGKWDGVLHFAALSLVGESMADPCRYLVRNAGGGLSLLQNCIRHGVPRFVLSSTANIYGDAGDASIGEHYAADPSSPYGESKWIIERALRRAAVAHGLTSVSLRYFNACGSEFDGSLGEDHDPETHLIPLAIDVALGRRPELVIYGSDHPTPDGTCVRDYVHVSDLAQAHLDALESDTKGAAIYNVGTGQGHSVLDVVQAVERVSGRRLNIRPGARRPGDPPVLVASNSRIVADMGWRPRVLRLDEAVETAFRWRDAHPDGYADRAVSVG